ncbi:MAG: HelD family protein [Pseudorhizobium sp.]
MNDPRQQEEHHLNRFLQGIEDNIHLAAADLKHFANEAQKAKDHMWEARRDMDHIDKIAIRQTIEQKLKNADVLQQRHKKLQKLRRSPYFGRVNFARSSAPGSEAPFYIGVHDFRDDVSGQTFVYDWRAPVSSLFYDFEAGPASYQAPGGKIEGLVGLKRQFRITDGHLEMMLDSSVNIIDDVLQQELGRASDEGMKNIVATIQRDQNAIIRDADAHSLIIQGVAGSGKTSIALHRIAFLLYRFKETLSSRDILIISPNKVFAAYIGNVLPELGEEQVAEIGMDQLADQLLEGRFRFQSLFEQTTDLLRQKDPALIERIKAKSSAQFIQQIDSYAEEVDAQSFQAVEWRSGLNRIVPAWHFQETWDRHRRLPLAQRVAEVVNATQHKVFMHYKYELRPNEIKVLREAVRAMTRPITLRAAYKGLFDWLEQPSLFKRKGAQLEHSDVFPLIYLKMKLHGVDNPFQEVKHLLVDEMQDYSNVQYAVLSRLFSCRKTILGDATQSVNPYGGSDAEQIQGILKASAPVKLTRSYRSTWEIMQFALAISPNDDLEPMKRHGEAPKIVTTASANGAIVQIIEDIKGLYRSQHRSLAVICKTEAEAAVLHRKLLAFGLDVQLVGPGSSGFSTGALVCTAHVAKGLEFDRVVVADAGARIYQTELDRNLLYVACTRAMHMLTVIVVGTPSPLLPGNIAIPDDHGIEDSER